MSSGEPARPADYGAVDRIVSATLAVDGVVGLHRGIGPRGIGPRGIGPSGVRLLEDGAEVHLVVGYGAALHGVAEAVRGAVAPLVTGPIDVIIEDVSTPGSGT